MVQKTLILWLIFSFYYFIEQIKKEKQVTKEKIANTNKELKEIKNKKPVVKKKTASQASKSLKNRIK